MTIQELFITNLKEYRKLRKFSQFQLAELCDSSQTYIAEIEVGKKFPSLAMIERIAAGLGLESYLLFRNEPIGENAKRKLTPLDKKEISEKLHAAAVKIISDY
jgi:transcriptional regulator with XRE-family HTH domain